MKKTINVIEIDSRDARYSSGIATYLNILADGMPAHINTYRIIFYRSPDFRDVTISDVGDELQIHHPFHLAPATLFDAVFAYIFPKLKTMQNLVVKSNCLSCEALAYLIKSRIYCKTIGVLHCQPPMNQTHGFVPADPYFNMDHIILVADNGQKYMKYWNCVRPHTVIYNGIATPPANKKRKQSKDVFNFIFANGWAVHKGFKQIIPAIRSVAKKHKIAVYVLGGHPDESASTFDEIADLPIINMGLIDDPAKINEVYCQADCALFASRSEACSFAGIEAMAYNLPIISTNANGLVEIFENAALYVEIGQNFNINADEYAKQMLRVINERALRIKLGAIGYSRFAARYTSKKMIAKTVAIYESLVK